MKAAARIYLVGMMGCGKSAVGRELARRLDYGFIDTDALVEAMTGRRVHELFGRGGESLFREEESRALRLAAARKNVVIATGGGAAISPANRQLMRRSGWVAYLEAAPEVLAGRVSRRGARRPLLEQGDPLETLRALLESRKAAYLEAAHARVDASNSVRQVAAALVEGMNQEPPKD